jgi:hypothetical protein
MSTAKYRPKSKWSVYPKYTDTGEIPVGYVEGNGMSSIPVTICNGGDALAEDVVLALNNLHFPVLTVPTSVSPVGQLFYHFVRRKLDRNGNSRNTVVVYTFTPTGFVKIGVENRVQSMGALQAAQEITSRWFQIPIKMVEQNVQFIEFPS